MAEIQSSVLARAGLKGRNPGEEPLQRNISVYERGRSTAAVIVNWRFTAKDAGAKLRRLYPDTSALNQYQTPCSPATAWGTFLPCVHRFY